MRKEVITTIERFNELRNSFLLGESKYSKLIVTKELLEQIKAEQNVRQLYYIDHGKVKNKSKYEMIELWFVDILSKNDMTADKYTDAIIVDGVYYSVCKYHSTKPSTMRFLFDHSSGYYLSMLPSCWASSNHQPPSFNVLTDKVVANWVDWLNRRGLAVAEERNRRMDNAESFIAMLKSLNTSKCSVVRICDDAGEIVAGGVRFTYTILENGFIAKTFDVVPTSVEQFITMCVN